MGIKLGTMTLGSLFKKPETTQYPFQTRFAPDKRKGHIGNDIETCILCGICSRVCPADAIVVNKPGSSWTIDGYRCVQCGSCIRECPVHCLTMEEALPAATAQKSTVTVEKPQKSEEELAAEKEAKKKAALEAKAAKEKARS